MSSNGTGCQNSGVAANWGALSPSGDFGKGLQAMALNSNNAMGQVRTPAKAGRRIRKKGYYILMDGRFSLQLKRIKCWFSFALLSYKLFISN
jgi:hypothetical protein